MSLLENILLQKLSFYNAIGIGEIILNIDDVELQEVGKLDLQALDDALKRLKRKGKIKSIIEDDHLLWIRINPGILPWYKKIFYRLDFNFLTRLFKK